MEPELQTLSISATRAVLASDSSTLQDYGMDGVQGYGNAAATAFLTLSVSGLPRGYTRPPARPAPTLSRPGLCSAHS